MLLIVAGGTGALLLLGYIAVRLLAAALFSLLYLLLAPAVVLAPAFGDRGRSLFRRWLAGLSLAVVSKLVFAFLLGVVLAVLAILASLPLGWWTRWLLMSAFWWTAFVRRHTALALADGAGGRPSRLRAAPLPRARHLLAREPRRVLETAGRRWRDRELRAAGADGEDRWAQGMAVPAVPAGDGGILPAHPDPQAARSAEHEHRDAVAVIREAPSIEAAISRREEQLWRLDRADLGADLTGNPRRLLEVRHRADRVRAEIAADAARLAHARSAAAGRDRPGDTPSPARIKRLAAHYDEQARLPAAREARGREGTRRDYASLAPLAGHGPEEYERLSSHQQRLARLQVDRELESRAAVTPDDRASVVQRPADPPGQTD